MTTNDDKTRLINNDDDEATRIANPVDDDATRLENPVQSAAENTDDEATVINPAAPVSKKAASKSQWASRLGFGAAGAAAGFAAGYAVSANASDTPKSGLTIDTDTNEADAEVEPEVTDKPADETINVNVEDTESTITPEIETEVETEHDFTAANNNFASTPGDDHIVGKNEVINGPAEHTVHATAANHHAAAAAATTANHPTAASVDVHIDENHLGQAEIHASLHTHTTQSTPEQPEITVQTEEGTIPEQSEIIIENEYGVGVAHVDDNMSFGEAFAAARQQVGAPGVFEWHGRIYGTYYAEEWNAMSVAERGEFIQHADFDRVTPDMTDDVAVIDEIPEDPATMRADDIEIIDITSTMTAGGEVSTTAHLSLQGNDVYMLDADGDGRMDVAITDIDGDGQYTEGIDVVEDISEHNITVDDVVEQIQNVEVEVEPQIEILDVTATLSGDGSASSAAHVSVDGTDVYMIDQDGDNMMDVMVVDTDGDGALTDADVVIDITDQNIAMNDIISEMNPEITAPEPAMGDDLAMNDFDPNSTPDF